MDTKTIIEALLLSSDQPLNIGQLQNCFPESGCPDKSEIRALLDELKIDYRERAVELSEVASGFRLQVRSEYSPWVAKIIQDKPPRYSRALLETLAIIAYRQPITRGGIEDVRGVSVSTTIVRTLMDREWIKIVGYREVPGKPAVYATTRKFLDDFNLKKLAQLPKLNEIRDLGQIPEPAVAAEEATAKSDCVAPELEETNEVV